MSRALLRKKSLGEKSGLYPFSFTRGLVKTVENITIRFKNTSIFTGCFVFYNLIGTNLRCKVIQLRR